MIDVSASARYTGDCRALLDQLPDGCVQTCITSPPYFGLRDYGLDGQIGLEETPAAFVAELVAIFSKVRRVLHDDGTLWINIGDSYAGSRSGPQGTTGQFNDRAVAHQRIGRKADGHRPSPPTPRAMNRKAEQRPVATSPYANLRRGSIGDIKHKDLIGIPWELAFALRADGWYLRQDIIWAKPNAMPESVTDRCTKSHEYLFLLSKSERYFYDIDAVRRPQKTRGERHQGRSGYRDGHPSKMSRTANERTLHPLGANLRSVWNVSTQPFKGAHFAVFPPALIEPCVLAGSRAGDLVLDPFFGSGTTGMVAERNGRRWIGFDLGYEDIAAERLRQASLGLGKRPSKAS